MKIDETGQRRQARKATASSGRRGRPLSEILETFERSDATVSEIAGVSSAALRAGAQIRHMRKARGLSQQALAQAVGVSQERISEIERGTGTQGPTFDVLQRCASACGFAVMFVDVAGDAGATREGDLHALEAEVVQQREAFARIRSGPPRLNEPELALSPLLETKLKA